MRKQRRLRDGAMAAATATAKAKLRARDMVRSISSEAADATSKRYTVGDQNKNTQQRVLPTELRRHLSGEVPHPALRKIRKGTKKKKPRRTRSGSSEYTRQSITSHLSSGDELDPVKQNGLEFDPHNKIPRVLPAALRRQLTGEESAPPLRRRQRIKGDSDPKEAAQQRSSTRRKPPRKPSEDSDIASEGDGSTDDEMYATKTYSNDQSVNEDSCRPSALQFDPTRKNNLDRLPISMNHNSASLIASACSTDVRRPSHTSPHAGSNIKVS